MSRYFDNSMSMEELIVHGFSDLQTFNAVFDLPNTPIDVLTMWGMRSDDKKTLVVPPNTEHFVKSPFILTTEP